MYERHNNRKNKNSRREKQVDNQEGRQIKPKFTEERKNQPVKPLTPKQAEYMRLLETCNIVVVTGLFGTGKTYIASAMAADKFKQNEIHKIIVARPYVEVGKSSGSKPGSTLEKLYPFVRNTLDTIQQRLGYQMYQNALKDGLTGSIEVQEVASIRGRSFDEHSWLIVDEAQLVTEEEMLAIVSRVSDNCKLVLCGDLKQRDNKGTSGLAWFMEFVKRHNIRGVGHIDFNSTDDIVRGGVVRDIAVGLHRDKQRGIKTPESC